MGRKFDKKFINEVISIINEKLKDRTILENEKGDLLYIINKFDKYLENDEIDKLKDIEVEAKEEKIDYKKLKEKLKKDLDIFGVELLVKTQYLYNGIDHTIFNDKNYDNISISEEEMLNLILDFYENIDNEYYKKALQIIQYPYSLINFDKKSKFEDECFHCKCLKLPFINVKSCGDYKYVAFVHELQHGIDGLLTNYNVFAFFRELAPMFFEVIFTDILNSMNYCGELYSSRINNHVSALKCLDTYADILMSFAKFGENINQYNIKSILNVTDERELEYRYKKIMNINFVDCYRYVLSFFRCIQLREKYYNGDKKQAIKELKDAVSGKNNEINFDKLIMSYNNYVEEIKEKQKDYQKTVNL